jgi:ABC-type molybdate transport system substrate-binding protein
MSLPGASRADLLLGAPTSLARTVNALLDGWQAAGGGEVKVTYGNSDDQAVETEAGGSYDVIILGDSHALYRLVSKGLNLDPLRIAASPIVFAAKDCGSELGSGQLAVYDPDSDGIGVATRDLLSQDGRWEPLSKKMLMLQSAHAIQHALADNEAQSAILLRADLARIPSLHECKVLSSQDYAYLAVPLRAHFRPEVAKFMGFLRSPAAMEEIHRRGFEN